VAYPGNSGGNSPVINSLGHGEARARAVLRKRRSPSWIVFPSPTAFDDASAGTAERDIATLIAEWDLARAATAGADLDDCFTIPDAGQISLRTLINHMIEEYARHIGHADLLRECIDGVTGE
jgi:hypothetical protein